MNVLARFLRLATAGVPAVVAAFMESRYAVVAIVGASVVPDRALGRACVRGAGLPRAVQFLPEQTVATHMQRLANAAWVHSAGLRYFVLLSINRFKNESF